MSNRWRHVGRPLRVAIAGVFVAVLLALVASAGSVLIVRRDVSAPDAFITLASHEWERIPAVARLARQQPQAKVLLTNPVQPSIANCHLCPDRARWLVSLGVAADRIVVLPRRVNNTHDEALAVAEYRNAHPVRQLMVVTSPYHARRALAVFQAVLGADVRIGVHPALEQSPARPARWWSASYDRAYVAYEWVALAWYRVRYGIGPMVAATIGATGISAVRSTRTL